MGCKRGLVVSVTDEYDGKRIKAKIIGVDDHVLDKDLPYAFPLLPKYLQVMPKVGEAVGIFFDNDDNPYSQRYYVGPIISQPQNMAHELYSTTATALMDGGMCNPKMGVSNNSDTYGAFAEDEDIAFYGRMNSDIFLKNNEIQVRCGVRHVSNMKDDNVKFNTDSPAYMLLKYYETPLHTSDDEEVKSIANLVGQKINIISTDGSPYFNTVQKDADNPIKNNLSTDEAIKKMIESAHKLPYGDTLIEFLAAFYNVFKSHTHAYSGLSPVEDPLIQKFEQDYGTTQKDYSDRMLSKNIAIN